jgi:long-subunit fatty acid transport protein
MTGCYRLRGGIRMRINKRGLQAFILILLLALFNANAWALVAFEQSLNFNFRFNNPGARANAMGGAFIGMADDATAAYTNPAGLTILTKPEVSIEYKRSEYENTFFDINGTGFDFDEEADGVSFLSYVIPYKKSTLAVYRHQLVDIQSNYSIDLFQNSTETNLQVITLGLGFGLKLTENFSIGASVGFANLDYNFSNEFFSDASLTPPPTFKDYVDGDDQAEHYTVSFLWNPIGEFNIGLVYRSGPEFDTNFVSLQDLDGDRFFEKSQITKTTLKVPDVYGIGVSYRFPDGLTVAIDANYIEYSDLLKDLVFRGGTTVKQNGLRISDYAIDDTIETHVGLEYVFDMKQMPVAVRFGYSFKPEHRIKYEGPKIDEQFSSPEGEDDHIFSLGFGAVLFEDVQVDLAASFGDYEKEYTASFVYRFE